MVQESKYFQLMRDSKDIGHHSPPLFFPRVLKMGCGTGEVSSEQPAAPTIPGGLSGEPGGQAGCGDHGTGKPTLREPGEAKRGETAKGSP